MARTSPKTMSPKKKRPAHGRRAKKTTMADRADRHVLYQRAVQDVAAEIDFVDETYRKLRGRPARILREDFAGTANTSCEWVRRRSANRAFAVDLDPEVLAWGMKHNVGKLTGEQQKRIQLIEGDVRTTRTEPADVLLGMNFSYWLFKTRDALLAYFKAAKANLVPGEGVLFLDAYGGWDAHKTIREPRDCGRFTYIWDQAEFDPISHGMTCYIHFKFPDGSKMERAFSYHWRLWSLPEIRELLAEAGFRKTTVYWEGADDDSLEGNGEFEPVYVAESDPGWLSYIVAEQ